MLPQQEVENPTTEAVPIREEDRQDVVDREEEIYGDPIQKKEDNTLRIVFLNINSF